ncbi:tRNA-guanine(15) transglycosylase [uncultured archaeon]|nr:tRNA-guanine(15) transglycosylase [uncultured archaeon]
MMEKETKERASYRRVVVKDAAVPFVARGGRVFSRQVIDSDPGVENGEIVQVVDRRDNILSTVQVYIEP